MTAPGPAPDLPVEIFAARRDRLLNSIGDGVAIVPSAPELMKSRDTEVRYRQSSDLYYLTGLTEPSSVAVLTPFDPTHRFTLFVRPRDPEKEAWMGSRAGVDGARERFGADAAYPIDELAARLPDLLRQAPRVHYPIGTSSAHDAAVIGMVAANRRQRQRTGSGPTAIVDLEASTGQMRVIKDAAEIDRIRVSAAIAAEGHCETMRRSRPGIGEWELQAAFEGSIRALGASGPAFLTIAGSAENGTILHYVDNDRRAQDGDLVLVDAGAEWGMYCSDISRTFPVSGRFLSHQRDVYDVVLAAERAGIAAARPGTSLASIHETVVRILIRGLLDLGLLKEGSIDSIIESGAYRRYYPHQTSHWLGLDVHDVGLYRTASGEVHLEPGMVFTIEPGLYIPSDAGEISEIYRGMGVRLEDDLVVLEHGCEVITGGVPVEACAVESLVGTGR